MGGGAFIRSFCVFFNPLIGVLRTDEGIFIFCDQISFSVKVFRCGGVMEIDDELRMRFTVWLKIVVKHAKIDYIRRQNRRSVEVSIENVENKNLQVYEQEFDNYEESLTFDFESETTATAFAKLSPKRKQVLFSQIL